MNPNRQITLRLLQLIRDLRNKASELEGFGIKLVLADEMIDEITSAMFDINYIDPGAAGTLHLFLADYLAGDIEVVDFLSLMNGQAVTA